MRKLFLFSTVALILSGCNNNEATETDQENNEQISEVTDSNQDQENNDTEIDEESTESADYPEGENQNQENTKMTEKEAEEKVIDYKNEQEDHIDPEGYEYLIQDEGAVYTVSMHAAVATDETKGAPIISKYEIDKETGEVKEIEVGPYEPDSITSEIVSMSEEQRRVHHRQLFAGDESIDDNVLNHLMLPGLHQNTTTYEGRLNPGDTVILSLVILDTPPSYQALDSSPEVDEEGYFTIDLSPYDLTNKTFLRFSIEGDYSEEQIFDVPIRDELEGMENVGVRG